MSLWDSDFCYAAVIIPVRNLGPSPAVDHGSRASPTEMVADKSAIPASAFAMEFASCFAAGPFRSATLALRFEGMIVPVAVLL